MPLTHWFLAFAAVLIWGTNFVVITWGLAELPPFLFSTLRFLLTAFPWIFFVKRPPIRWRSFAGFGVLMGAGQFGLLYFAMHRYITPGLASLLMQTQVIFTILLALVIRKNRISSLQVVALALAAIGIGLIAWRSATGAAASVTLFGVLLVLAAAFCWALANLLVQSVGQVDVIAFLIWSSVFAVPPLLLLSLLFEGAPRDLEALAGASATAWCVILWQVFGNTLFGFGVWNWLLARHAASVVTPVALLIPVFGMTASAWLLSESLPLWKVAAASLVLLGLALNAYASRPQSAAP
ncbi:MAG TPA: EamA family transporter [Steroidobacteraceae bacterium]|nr:EamA family transporter [Steroidobacteraceae bacterium]